MGKYPDSVNKYNHTPRKVFDKYVEKLERKMARVVKDLADLEKAVIDLQDTRLRHDLDIDELGEQIDNLEFTHGVGSPDSKKEDRE